MNKPKDEIAQVEFDGLTHDCTDPDCHVAGFVATLGNVFGHRPDSPISRTLTSRAQSYFRDAQRFADMPSGDLAAAGMTHEQWAVVYRTVADELHKIAAEVSCG